MPSTASGEHRASRGDSRQNVSVGVSVKHAIDLIAEHEDRARSVVISRAIKQYVASRPDLIKEVPAIDLALNK
tara:strand:- start:360 stop:578 length:219 start_codon:yes stop_codon:yes gene_type:complete